VFSTELGIYEPGGQICADAYDGGTNIAEIDVYAGRDVIIDGGEVEYTGLVLEEPVGFYDGYSEPGGHIWATAGWGDGTINEATVGVYAQGDVTVKAGIVTGDPPEDDLFEPVYPGAQIAADAYGSNDSINTSEVDICAQDDVAVDGEVWAESGTEQGPGSEHRADVVIAAGDEITGSGGIFADADGDASVVESSITFIVTGEDKDLFEGDLSFEPDIEVGEVDCPECEFEWIDWAWCEECEEPIPPEPEPEPEPEAEPEPEEPEPFTLPAPLADITVLPGFEEVAFALGGCPALMAWLADELGIPEDEIQVFVAGAFALNTNVQPCEACARLKEAASVLEDEDGARIAALAQVVNEFAAPGAPIAPEQMAAIASAIATPAPGTQYAAARQWLDALVAYVGVLNTEMGFSTAQAVAFAGKYTAAATAGSDANLAAYVQARLATLGAI
ncbi:MAG: hypothetical protein ACYS29_15480, partial [Planctomycetota bacterium]